MRTVVRQCSQALQALSAKTHRQQALHSSIALHAAELCHNLHPRTTVLPAVLHSQRSLASKGPSRGSWWLLCRIQPTGLSCHMSLWIQRAYLHVVGDGSVRGQAGRQVGG